MSDIGDSDASIDEEEEELVGELAGGIAYMSDDDFDDADWDSEAEGFDSDDDGGGFAQLSDDDVSMPEVDGATVRANALVRACATRFAEQAPFFEGDIKQHRPAYRTTSDPDYDPVDVAKCRVLNLEAEVHHAQTCDSICVGPNDTGDASQPACRISKITSNFHFNACELKPITETQVPNNSAAASAYREMTGHTESMNAMLHPGSASALHARQLHQAYSIRWNSSHEHMAVTTASGRLQFWWRPHDRELRAEATTAQRPEAGATSCATPDTASLPCGSLIIPDALPSSPIKQLARRHMLNCVRFGTVAGEERAIVAAQNGTIYLFALPAWTSPQRIPAQQYILKQLRPEGAKPRLGTHTESLRDLLAPVCEQDGRGLVILDDDAAWRTAPVFTLTDDHNQAEWHAALSSSAPASALAHTMAIGPFTLAINSAEPSPDGNWIAALSDTMAVLLLPEALDYSPCAAAALSLDGRLERDTESSRNHETIGCQYAAWHRDSTYLAASSDSHCAVAVWRITKRSADALDNEALGAAIAAQMHDGQFSAEACAMYADLTDERLQMQRLAGMSMQYRHQLESCDADALAKQRVRVKCAARALWNRVGVEPVSVYSGHARACMALAFVPSFEATLVWLEARNLVHIADVRGCSRAHHIVHLHTLPLQIALAHAPAPPVGYPHDSLDGAIADDACAHAAQGASGRSTAARGVGVCPGQTLRDASLAAQADAMGMPAIDVLHAPILAADDTPKDPSDPVQLVSLWHAVQLVLRAWHFCNIHEQQRLYCVTMPPCEVFPDYQQLVGALWGDAADIDCEGRSESASPQLREFVRVVLEQERVELLPPTRNQEMEAALQVFNILQHGGANKLTGLAVVAEDEIAVASERSLFRLRLTPKWQPQHSWPRAFRRAAATVLLIGRFGQAHACAARAQTAGLWSLPADVVRKIIALAAGERVNWLQRPTVAPDAGVQAGADTGAIAQPQAYQGVLPHQLLHSITQRPLTRLRFAQGRAGRRFFEPDVLPPSPYIE